jgi:hypothetical protein
MLGRNVCVPSATLSEPPPLASFCHSYVSEGVATEVYDLIKEKEPAATATPAVTGTTETEQQTVESGVPSGQASAFACPDMPFLWRPEAGGS